MRAYNLLLVVGLMAISAGRLVLAQTNTVESVKPAAAAIRFESEPTIQAPPTSFPADVTKLVATAAANFDRNDLLAKNYTYQIATDQTFYNKHGKIDDHHTAKYEVVGLDKGEYDRLTEWNEKPVSAKDQARRDAAEAHDEATRDKAKHRKVCERIGFFHRRVSFPLASFNEFPAFFNMRILGTEMVHGRSAYVIEAMPRSDAKTTDEREKAELNFQAKLWLDVADTIPVQAHYQAIADCQCVLKGSSFELEWQKINDEAWFRTHWVISAKVKYVWWQQGIQAEFTASNFRKFTVDTRIGEPSTQPMPESSERAPSPSAMPSHAADEEAIRSLVQKIIAAYQQRDSQTLFSFFTGNSPNLLVVKMEIESGWAQHEAVERKDLTIRDIAVSEDSASVRVSYHWSGANGAAAEVSSTGENFFILELTREAGAWKWWNLLSDAEGFAEELLAAESDQERNRLLTTEGSQVTEELVEILVGKGHELMAMGQYDAARSRFDIARTVADQLHDRKALAWALYGLGHGSLAQGDEAAADDYFNQAVAIGEARGDNSELAAAFSFIGQHYAELGKYRRAMEYYHKSIAASEKSGSNELLALALASVGDVFAMQGNDDQALDYYERSQKLFVFGKTLSSIGEVMTRKGNYAQALEHYRKSLQFFQDSAYFSLAAAGLRRMGDNYFLQGQLDDALDHYRKSLEKYEELDHKTGRAITLGRIANVYYQRREYDRAIEFATRARTLATTLESPSDLSSILTTLGKAYLANGKHDEAKQTLTEATSAVEKLRTGVVGSEQDQGLFFERKIDPYHAMVELLVKEHNFMEALAYAEREKGRVLLDVLRDGRSNIAEAMTPEERTQEQTLNQVLVTLNYELQRENLQRQPNQTVIEAIDAQLKKARLEYEAFETGLYAAHPDLRGQRGETPPLTEEELEALVSNSGTAFLEYVVQQERTYLFTLTPSSESAKDSAAKLALRLHVVEISADELAKLVADFRTKLAANALDFREPARRLYQLLLAPAETALAGKRTVCLVPAGPLWELPFQALLTKQNRYLLEEHAVFYVPSLSVLQEMRTRTVKTAFVNHESDDPDATPFMQGAALPTILQTLFAVGNPAVSPGEEGGQRRPGVDGPYAPLPEQGNLVRTLGQIYGSKNSRILIGQAATEETVKAEAGKYGILHFSAHGTLDNDNPLYSHLLLSAASTKEDGFFEAREILQLKLQADLAVLSGCETARGRVRAGEGLMGMSWAFFVAGTPTTVASQWQVDSASTARLMIAFHRRLKAQLLPAGLELSKSQALRHPLVFHRLLRAQRSGLGWQMSKAELLREASLQLMSDPKYRHPFYWAGFVVMGDGL